MHTAIAYLLCLLLRFITFRRGIVLQYCDVSHKLYINSGNIYIFFSNSWIRCCAAAPIPWAEIMSFFVRQTLRSAIRTYLSLKYNVLLHFDNNYNNVIETSQYPKYGIITVISENVNNLFIYYFIIRYLLKKTKKIGFLLKSFLNFSGQNQCQQVQFSVVE